MTGGGKQTGCSQTLVVLRLLPYLLWTPLFFFSRACASQLNQEMLSQLGEERERIIQYIFYISNAASPIFALIQIRHEQLSFCWTRRQFILYTSSAYLPPQKESLIKRGRQFLRRSSGAARRHGPTQWVGTDDPVNSIMWPGNFPAAIAGIDEPDTETQRPRWMATPGPHWQRSLLPRLDLYEINTACVVLCRLLAHSWKGSHEGHMHQWLTFATV